MFRKLRSRLTYANVAATGALVFAMSGFAVASIPGPGGVVKGCYSKSTGSLRVIDSKKGCSKKHERTLSWNQQGPRGLQGIQGGQGIQGIPGTARAYGQVASSGMVTRSQNVTGVTKPFGLPGRYCIALAAGIDASQTGVVATPNHSDDSTNFPSTNGSQALAEWLSVAPDCPAGQLEVETGIRQVQTVGSADGDVRTVNLLHLDEGFFFVVP